MLVEDAVIFIDTQLYVDLYRTVSGKDLLALLEEQRDYIFITEQIVGEVNKHKLSDAKDFFQRECQIAKNAWTKLPNHLFDDDGTIVKRISEKLRTAAKLVREATEELERAVADTLHSISLSEDTVSKALAPLFARARPHKPEELERAIARNARGIPPGKKAAPIGDELNWEQFLSFVKYSGKRRLWIISRDTDYCLTHGKRAIFLLPPLHQELMRHISPPPDVYAFTNIPDGIKHFSENTGVKADKLPTAERVEQIKKEQEKLPPSGTGSGQYAPTTTTTAPPSGYYSGSGYNSNMGTTTPSPGYHPGSASGWNSGEQSGQLYITWAGGDGERSPMTFEAGMWKGPTHRRTGSGDFVIVPPVEVRDEGVMVDGICYPIDSRNPFLANLNHNGLGI
jgi:hypothetical protein